MSYHEELGELTARIIGHVDLAGMSMAERVDLMTALSELAALPSPMAAGSASTMPMPSMAVRHPACTPLTPGGCAAGYIERGLAHCCISKPHHDGVHRCTCDATWDEVGQVHVDDACGESRQTDAEHLCVCHLAVHNTIAGPDMLDRPMHACAECGASWSPP